jgi:hypothetical protein
MDAKPDSRPAAVARKKTLFMFVSELMATLAHRDVTHILSAGRSGQCDSKLVDAAGHMATSQARSILIIIYIRRIKS